jgi:hypothetical protein
MTGSRAGSACIQPPNAVGPGAQLADEQDRLDGATSRVPMAIATWRHSVGNNSSNFVVHLDLEHRKLGFEIPRPFLRRFKRWEYCLHPAIDFQAKAFGHHRSARVMLRGCGSSGIVTVDGLRIAPEVASCPLLPHSRDI